MLVQTQLKQVGVAQYFFSLLLCRNLIKPLKSIVSVWMGCNLLNGLPLVIQKDLNQLGIREAVVVLEVLELGKWIKTAAVLYYLINHIARRAVTLTATARRSVLASRLSTLLVVEEVSQALYLYCLAKTIVLLDNSEGRCLQDRSLVIGQYLTF